MMFTKNDPNGYKQLLPGVHLKTQVYGEKTLLGEFHIDLGAIIPMHNHPHEQTGYLISGKMEFDVAGEQFTVEPGDSWCIPGNTPHSARAAQAVRLVEVFSPVREDYLP
jgi:quercetin dioxygenase-like cupin family protein